MNKAVKERFHLFEWKVKVNSLLVVSPLPERGGVIVFLFVFLQQNLRIRYMHT